MGRGATCSVGEVGRRSAIRWLTLAACAVATSGLFAILIALARVPALGNFFPGAEFYRVALTLHVNLSQGVWFMSFAGVLWSLGCPRIYEDLDRVAWLAAMGGAIGMVLSVLDGQPTPLMSNYLPVLDSPMFLGALSLFGLGVLLKSLGAFAGFPRWRIAEVRQLALFIPAAGMIVVVGLLFSAAMAIRGRLNGLFFFETLFWGGGHVWQFALISLLMFCWLELAPEKNGGGGSVKWAALVGCCSVPVTAALIVPFFDVPDSTGYAYAYTWIMQWLSWEAPLAVGIILWWRSRLPAPGFLLSFVLFIFGLLLGSMINGQTTLITAHYHGTIGAVTLSFMAATFVLLPRLGIEPPSLRVIRLQLGFYGYGIMLMMAGLAGAGLMGAPRKTPGDLSLGWNIETVSRICLGIGGLLAMLGILLFAFLLIRRLFPMRSAAVCPR